MTQKQERKQRRKPKTLEELKRESESAPGIIGKKVPGGLLVLLHSIAVSWPPQAKTRKLREFTIFNFGKYNKVAREYGAREYKNERGLYDHFNKMNKGGVTPNFIDMKFFADYVGIPVGVLLLISQFIGAELMQQNNSLREYEDKLWEIIAHYDMLKSDLFSPDGHAFVSLGKTNGIPELDIEKMYKVIYTMFQKPSHIAESEDIHWLSREITTSPTGPFKTQLLPSPQ